MAQAQAWDLATGEIHAMSGATVAGDGLRVPLVLGPYEAKVIVVGPLPKAVAAAEPSFIDGKDLAVLDGDWELDLNGKQLTTPLKAWEELGAPGFAGPATYRRQFTAPATPAGKHVFLEIGNVSDYAKVTLNGKELGAHAWPPYRWDLTSALKRGANDLVIQVNAIAAGGRRQGGQPPAAAAANGTAVPAAAPGAAGTAAGARRRTGAGGPGVAGAPPAGATGGADRAPASPAASGLLGPVRMVAY